MTKEDIKQICQIYDNFRRERDAATIIYNSDDTFWEHILATYNLSQPSLPSNLDEAAEENSKNYYCSCLENHNETGICDGCENVKLAFKAGAEWMAGQGQTFGAHVDNGCAIASGVELPFVLWDTYEDGDVLKVQIRKK